MHSPMSPPVVLVLAWTAIPLLLPFLPLCWVLHAAAHTYRMTSSGFLTLLAMPGLPPISTICYPPYLAACFSLALDRADKV